MLDIMQIYVKLVIEDIFKNFFPTRLRQTHISLFTIKLSNMVAQMNYFEIIHRTN